MICLFARENRQICASGSGVERRLAKAKVAGSNPVSRSCVRARKSSVYAGFRVLRCLENVCDHCVTCFWYRQRATVRAAGLLIQRGVQVLNTACYGLR